MCDVRWHYMQYKGKLYIRVRDVYPHVSYAHIASSSYKRPKCAYKYIFFFERDINVRLIKTRHNKSSQRHPSIDFILYIMHFYGVTFLHSISRCMLLLIPWNGGAKKKKRLQWSELEHWTASIIIVICINIIMEICINNLWS